MSDAIRPLKFRDLVRRLKKYDSRFTIAVLRGRGSHRMLYHPEINGRAESYPLTCHGENTPLGVGHIKSILRRFSLPREVMTGRIQDIKPRPCASEEATEEPF